MIVMDKDCLVDLVQEKKLYIRHMIFQNMSGLESDLKFFTWILGIMNSSKWKLMVLTKFHIRFIMKMELTYVVLDHGEINIGFMIKNLPLGNLQKVGPYRWTFLLNCFLCNSVATVGLEYIPQI